MVTDAMRVGSGSLIQPTLPLPWGWPLFAVMCEDSDILNKVHGGTQKKNLYSLSSAQDTEAPTLSSEQETAAETSHVCCVCSPGTSKVSNASCFLEVIFSSRMRRKSNQVIKKREMFTGNGTESANSVLPVACACVCDVTPGHTGPAISATF